MANIIKVNSDHYLFLNHVVSAERAEVEISVDDDDKQKILDPYGATVKLSSGDELALTEKDAEALFKFLNLAEKQEREHDAAIRAAIAGNGGNVKRN